MSSTRKRTLHESAHKLGDDGELPDETPRRSGVRQNFNEAAHKLSYWPVAPAPRKTKEPSDVIKAAHNDDRDVPTPAPFDRDAGAGYCRLEKTTDPPRDRPECRAPGYLGARVFAAGGISPAERPQTGGRHPAAGAQPSP